MLGKGAVLSGPPSTTPSSLPSQIPRQASLLPPLPLPPRPPSVLSRLPRRQSVHVVMTIHPGRCCLSQAASWLFQLYFLSDHARVFELASFSRSCYRSAFIRLGVLWADRTFASDGCSQPALVSSPPTASVGVSPTHGSHAVLLCPLLVCGNVGAEPVGVVLWVATPTSHCMWCCVV